VDETLACVGTAIEQARFTTGGKSFLFVEGKKDQVVLRFKLDKSLEKAAALGAKRPDEVQAGKGGWVTVRIAHGKKGPPGLARWIAESHAMSAGGKKKSANKKAAKKKTAKKSPAKKSPAKKKTAKKKASSPKRKR
jgi:hypothetical protein